MWYNARPVLRRGFTLTLLAILAVQLLGAMTAVCFEPCPDDASGAGCPPVCATCITCTHSGPAIVPASADGILVVTALDAFVPHAAAPSAAPTADIFHVPLLG